MLPIAKTQPKPNLADLTVLVYGQTKIGKSTLCSQADSALFLATEPGLNALDVYQVPIQSWEDLRKACAEIVEGNHPFKTVILDTIDNAYKFCTEYIVSFRQACVEAVAGAISPGMGFTPACGAPRCGRSAGGGRSRLC